MSRKREIERSISQTVVHVTTQLPLCICEPQSWFRHVHRGQKVEEVGDGAPSRAPARLVPSVGACVPRRTVPRFHLRVSTLDSTPASLIGQCMHQPTQCTLVACGGQ
jgi:hypothetical protein